MNINNNFLEGISKKILEKKFGEEHLMVLGALNKPEYDEQVAKSLDMKATIVRKLLNEMHNHEFVAYKRSKNPLTGWYTYVWERRDDKISGYLENYMKQKLMEIEQYKKIQEGNGHLENPPLFMCKDCGKEMTFIDAMSVQFSCPECEGNIINISGEMAARIMSNKEDEMNAEI